MNKSLSTLIVILVFIFALMACNTNSTNKGSIMIGIAESNFTPEVGLNLVGNYRGDDYASRGIHDSLYSRAIVAQGEDGETAAILTVDICYFKKDAVDFMREYIETETGIPGENVMILATHTHSGPESDINAPLAKEYLSKAADAVKMAQENLAPSVIAVGKSKEDRISHVRRLLAKDGTIHMTWENMDPDLVENILGQKDPEVITFSVNQEGKEIGSIVNFGCHATCLTGDNWLYSADYPGYLVESIRKVKGGNYLPVFFNGCCGNVTQIDYKIGHIYTFQEAQRIGYLLGVSALEAINNQKTMKGEGIVKVSREYVPIKHMTISGEQVDWANKVLEKVKREGMPPLQRDGLPDAFYAKEWLKMHAIEDKVDSIEIMVTRIGNLAFVGLTSEPFAEFGSDIKSKSPCPNTMVMGLANNSVGYFPTQNSYQDGPKGFTPMISGYETTPGTSKYEIGSGEILSASAVRQLKLLFD